MKKKRRIVGALLAVLVITIGTLGVGSTANAEHLWKDGDVDNYASNSKMVMDDNGVVMWRLYNRNTGEHFYTKEDLERHELNNKVGWLAENAGFIAVDSGIPVYRLYSQYSGDHHYTADSNERNHLISVGWNDEGIGFYTLPEGEGFPVYRLYNPNAITASHHYTLDEAERDMLISLGWQDEGIAFQSLHDIYTKELTASCIIQSVDSR